MKRIVVILEPRQYPKFTELMVKVEANGQIYEDKQIISDDAFHSLFERLMMQATKTIVSLMEQEVKEATP